MPDIDLSDRKKLALFLFIGLAVGAGATYVASNLDSVSADEAGEKVVSTLEQQTDQELELIKVETENRLYKVDVRTQDDRVSTFYVTKDGAMFASENALTDIDRATRVMDAQEEFSSCLSDKSVVMYGNLTQRETQVQIQALGGTQQVAPIYKDVNDPENLQEAANRGVEALPTFYYDGSLLQGVNDIPQIEEFTGCSYNLEEEE